MPAQTALDQITKERLLLDTKNMVGGAKVPTTAHECPNASFPTFLYLMNRGSLQCPVHCALHC